MTEKELFPIVLLIREDFDGRIFRDWLPAPLAVVTLLYDDRNGREGGFARGRIYWSFENVNARLWDMSV